MPGPRAAAKPAPYILTTFGLDDSQEEESPEVKSKLYNPMRERMTWLEGTLELDNVADSESVRALWTEHCPDRHHHKIGQFALRIFVPDLISNR